VCVWCFRFPHVILLPLLVKFPSNPTVMVRVIHQLGKNSIQTHRDKLDVLRHIIKNVSKRLVQLSDIRKLSDVTKLSHPYSE
jgi:hypothetical protein